ncbi:MAG: hypothetical protein J7525_14125 [Roseofilum sp. SID3]|uniref:hypothetical protein n=1 Tax=Roseofilum sp. SID3 TaxID=2821499 RepID=UPI001B291A75|nr:hypothetical protein [Roseofilum sp. SID3]MBP0014230.1 hypothetical protein [Roseofilum sp. SID3]
MIIDVAYSFILNCTGYLSQAKKEQCNLYGGEKQALVVEFRFDHPDDPFYIDLPHKAGNLRLFCTHGDQIYIRFKIKTWLSNPPGGIKWPFYPWNISSWGGLNRICIFDPAMNEGKRFLSTGEYDTEFSKADPNGEYQSRIRSAVTSYCLGDVECVKSGSNHAFYQSWSYSTYISDSFFLPIYPDGANALRDHERPNAAYSCSVNFHSIGISNMGLLFSAHSISPYLAPRTYYHRNGINQRHYFADSLSDYSPTIQGFSKFVDSFSSFQDNRNLYFGYKRNQYVSESPDRSLFRDFREFKYQQNSPVTRLGNSADTYNSWLEDSSDGPSRLKISEQLSELLGNNNEMMGTVCDGWNPTLLHRNPGSH